MFINESKGNGYLKIRNYVSDWISIMALSFFVTSEFLKIEYQYIDELIYVFSLLETTRDNLWGLAYDPTFNNMDTEHWGKYQ